MRRATLLVLLASALSACWPSDWQERWADEETNRELAVPATADPFGLGGAPEGWVRYDTGGNFAYGPAVYLCGARGGAAPGECDGVVIDQPVEVGAPHFAVDAATGAITGGWRGAGEPDGPITTIGVRAGRALESWTTLEPWSCPSGWTPIDRICAPTRVSCPDGDLPLPSGACALAEISTCSGLFFPAVPPGASNVAYVDPAADPMVADGTASRPFASPSDALAAGHSWILLSAGVHPSPTTLPSVTHFVGVCPPSTTLSVPPGTTLSVEGTLEMEGLTVSGGAPAILASSGARVVLRGVRLDGASTQGVRALGATLDFDGVVIQHVAAVAGEMVVGISADPSSEVLLRRVAIAEVPGSAIATTGTLSLLDSSIQLAPGGRAVTGSGDLTIASTTIVGGAQAVRWAGGARVSDLTVADVVTLPAVSAAISFFAPFGQTSNVVATRLHLADTVGTGLHVAASVNFALDRSVLERWMPRAEPADGDGIGVLVNAGDARFEQVTIANADVGLAVGGGQILWTHSLLQACRVGLDVAPDTIAVVTAQNSVIERSGEWGLRCLRGGSCSLSDVLLRRSGAAVGAAGGAVLATGGSQVTITASLVADTTGIAIEAAGRGTNVTIDGSAFDGVSDGGSGGAAISGRGGAVVEAQGSTFVDIEGSGVRATEFPTHIALTNCEVSDVRTSASGGLGEGVYAQLDSDVALSGTLLDHLTGAGITSTRLARVSMSASAVENVSPLADGSLGRGIQILSGGSLVADGILVSRVSEVGLAIEQSGTNDISSAQISRVLIEHIAPSNRAMGFGILLRDRSSLGQSRSVSIVDTTAAGLVSATDLVETMRAQQRNRNVTLYGFFVDSVRPGTFAVDDTGQPIGRAVSYAVYAGDRTVLFMRSFVLANANVGFARVGDGLLDIRDGAATDLRASVGVFNLATGLETYSSIDTARNVDDGVLFDADLPEVALAPPPRPSCLPGEVCD